MPLTIYRGPAQVEYGGIKFQPQTPVTVNMAPQTFDVTTDAHGFLDERIANVAYQVSFTPSGQWEELIAAMAAVTGKVPGESLLSGALVVRPLINPQKVMTLARAGITGFPTLRLTSQGTLYDGNVTFTALHAAGTEDWSATTGIATFASHADSLDTAFGPAKIPTEPWIGIWDEDPDDNPTGVWSEIRTESGWSLSIDLQTSNALCDDVGIADVTLASVKTSVSCVPVGISDEDLVTALQHGGTNALGPGRSLRWHDAGVPSPRALKLINRSQTHYIQLPDAGLRGGPAMWGANSNRIGELSWVSLRKFTAGVPGALMGAGDITPPIGE